MEIRVDFPLDVDGFLRRECPNCTKEFKWHHGPTDTRPDDAADPPRFYCPLCGQRANHDQWFTQDQVHYQQQVAEFYMHDALNDELQRAFRGLDNLTYEPGLDSSPAPTTLHEPNDMIIVESPCHPWEPIKVHEGRADSGPLHCLVCGHAFTA
jgi:hypothetical protein